MSEKHRLLATLDTPSTQVLSLLTELVEQARKTNVLLATLIDLEPIHVRDAEPKKHKGKK